MGENRNLDQLDPPAWSEPSASTHLVVTCHALRQKPVVDFTTEDLRIMIGQSISLPWLIPLAIDVLEDNAWAMGSFYEGDLLVATTQVSSDFWSLEANDKLLKRMLDVVHGLDDALVAKDKLIASAVLSFSDCHPSS